MTCALTKTRENFIEMIGLSVQDFGLRRASGRILGLMVFDGAEMSAPALSDALGISKASVNTGLQELQSRSVIRKISHPADRTTYYQLHPDPYGDLMRQAADQSRMSGEAILQAREAVPSTDTERRDRLRCFAGFYTKIAAALDAAGHH
ncbi:GbsR/MarR family transcriptional regulator [Loktanella sp. M215]|uniref:GbsR/MarR family transcriptional regulator n=1 Tax=Loktanella sp. M215 TaxID=2675431 RepID=UPI001F26684F|nr:MarR family transcriptional regulator [Loktanella sp. M215]MCF7701819.1 hypothetical protein [Loktanella sp. M215]